MARPQRGKRSRRGGRRWLRWLVTSFVLVLILSGLAVGAAAFWVLTILPRSLPSVTAVESLERKLKEAVLALLLERRYSKNRILELYLNQIYFGQGAFGVEAAARTFFGKSVGELTLAESALLAGLPKVPATYSPFDHPDAA